MIIRYSKLWMSLALVFLRAHHYLTICSDDPMELILPNDKTNSSLWLPIKKYFSTYSSSVQNAPYALVL